MASVADSEMDLLCSLPCVEPPLKENTYVRAYTRNFHGRGDASD